MPITTRKRTYPDVDTLVFKRARPVRVDFIGQLPSVPAQLIAQYSTHPDKFTIFPNLSCLPVMHARVSKAWRAVFTSKTLMRNWFRLALRSDAIQAKWLWQCLRTVHQQQQVEWDESCELDFYFGLAYEQHIRNVQANIHSDACRIDVWLRNFPVYLHAPTFYRMLLKGPERDGCLSDLILTIRAFLPPTAPIAQLYPAWLDKTALREILYKVLEELDRLSPVFLGIEFSYPIYFLSDAHWSGRIPTFPLWANAARDCIAHVFGTSESAIHDSDGCRDFFGCLTNVFYAATRYDICSHDEHLAEFAQTMFHVFPMAMLATAISLDFLSAVSDKKRQVVQQAVNW